MAVPTTPEGFAAVLETLRTTDWTKVCTQRFDGFDLPPPDGGIQYGRYAVIRTFNRDGTTSDQPRVWRDGQWHDIDKAPNP